MPYRLRQIALFTRACPLWDAKSSTPDSAFSRLRWSSSLLRLVDHFAHSQPCWSSIAWSGCPSLMSLGYIRRTYPNQRVLLATQVYEKVDADSLRDVQALLDWSELLVYDLNEVGKNHGIVLGTSGWKP